MRLAQPSPEVVVDAGAKEPAAEATELAPLAVVAAPPVAKVKPVVARAAPKEVAVAAAPRCEPDEDWKRQARADLDELTQQSAERADLWLWAAEENDALSKAIALASSRGECATIEGRLRQFNQRLKGKRGER